MTLIPGMILLVVAFVLLVPVTVLFVECLVSLFPSRRTGWDEKMSRPKVAVLVPAHNEAPIIGQTLRLLLPQLAPDDQLIVIADNCTDETAKVAWEAGATVIERQDHHRRGKGFALDFGLNYVQSSPPDVVVVVDADCAVAEGAIAKISQMAIAHSRPVQATYLMARSARPKPKEAISSLAFMVKNLVRPAGMDRMGLPCLLTGTGMAFPWAVMQKVSLASGNIVEDMKLALDFALVGHPPMFCRDARVTGVLPQQSHAAKSQRTRWEHGHLQTLFTQVPRLVGAAIQQGRFDLLALALDLSIPPLSLLVMIWGVLMLGTLGLTMAGGMLLPAIVTAISGGLILASILMVWAKFARDELPLGMLLSVPLYILWKIPLYFTFLVKPQTKWVRTDRDVVDSSPDGEIG